MDVAAVVSNHPDLEAAGATGTRFRITTSPLDPNDKPSQERQGLAGDRRVRRRAGDPCPLHASAVAGAVPANSMAGRSTFTTPCCQGFKGAKPYHQAYNKGVKTGRRHGALHQQRPGRRADHRPGRRGGGSQSLPRRPDRQGAGYRRADVGAGGGIEHGVILKVVSTNICGSDQHMVRGRTTAQCRPGAGPRDHRRGDREGPRRRNAEGRRHRLGAVQRGLRPLPLLQGATHRRLPHVNPSRAGGAYGYVDMGGWIGGQAEYVMVPYADFNLLKFPDRDKAMAKIRDLTMPLRHPAHRLPRRGDAPASGPGLAPSTSQAPGRWAWRRPLRPACWAPRCT
jgi:hypothetical protein